MLEYSKFTI